MRASIYCKYISLFQNQLIRGVTLLFLSVMLGKYIVTEETYEQLDTWKSMLIPIICKSKLYLSFIVGD